MPNNDSPYELIADVITAWIAAAGTARPAVDAAATGWTKVGTSGPLNYGPAGITTEHPQEVKKWKSLGSPTPIKAFRTEDGFLASWMLHDMTLEQLALVFNSNAVTTTPASSGVAGVKTIDLSRGFVVQTKALLLRGVSSYGDYVGQLWIPKCIITSSPKITHSPEEPAGVEIKFEGLYDSTYGLGKRDMQTAPAS
jgi:hypothetical protein